MTLAAFLTAWLALALLAAVAFGKSAKRGDERAESDRWLRAPLTLSRDAIYAPDETGRYRCTWVPEMDETEELRHPKGRKHAE